MMTASLRKKRRLTNADDPTTAQGSHQSARAMLRVAPDLLERQLNIAECARRPIGSNKGCLTEPISLTLGSLRLGQLLFPRQAVEVAQEWNVVRLEAASIQQTH